MIAGFSLGKSLVLEKIAGSHWSCSNRRRNITHWSCFYSCCNPDFSSFWLGVASATSGSSTVSTPSSYYASLYCTVAFGLNCFRSTGQVPPNAAATSQSFLTPPAILLRNESYYWVIFDSSQGLLTLDKVVSIDNEHMPKFLQTMCPSSMKISTQQQIKQQNFIGTTVVNMLRIDKTAATCSRHPCHRMDETKGFGRNNLYNSHW